MLSRGIGSCIPQKINEDSFGVLVDTWLIFRFRSYSPRVEVFEVQAFDIMSAINNSGIMIAEIIAVKLKELDKL